MGESGSVLGITCGMRIPDDAVDCAADEDEEPCDDGGGGTALFLTVSKSRFAMGTTSADLGREISERPCNRL